jgi:hypothetical protein
VKRATPGNCVVSRTELFIGLTGKELKPMQSISAKTFCQATGENIFIRTNQNIFDKRVNWYDAEHKYFSRGKCSVSSLSLAIEISPAGDC